MSVTLRQLYDSIKSSEEITLIAGEQGLDHVVRWVHMVEGTDISSFLEGDEVAFTTGIAVSDEKELLELVEYNYRQQASGMVINTGPYIEKISEEIIAFGNEHDFPIFQVPWRVHMANIMREFTKQINLDDWKEMELEAALKNALYLSKNVGTYLPVLQKHGYKKEWSYCVAAVEMQNKQFAPLEIAVHKKLLQYATDFFFQCKKHAVVLQSNDGMLLVLCVNVTEEWMEKQLTDFFSKVHQYLIKDIIFFAGIGRATCNAEQIGKSFAQAEQVKHLQKRLGRKNEAVSYQETGLYKLLFAIEDKEVIEEYYAETLGLLEKYDHVNETDYLYFLKQYFKLGCSVQEVAAQMHLHRNSVTYKLHKIEEILKMSVNEPEDRMKLMVAMMIREIR